MLWSGVLYIYLVLICIWCQQRVYWRLHKSHPQLEPPLQPQPQQTPFLIPFLDPRSTASQPPSNPPSVQRRRTLYLRPASYARTLVSDSSAWLIGLFVWLDGWVVGWLVGRLGREFGWMGLGFGWMVGWGRSELQKVSWLARERVG